MPKRIPTPPPADDEPRYLTVVHPYAISGTCNMELPKDRQDFARWVACCVDKDAFFAIFHKPSSRGMVIIEVNRHYHHFDRILGEHRWSEFLQNPTKEEMAQVTQVFYCAYNTGRIVQKNGWKRIDVDEAWFKAWSPKNRQIKFPYPDTHFCDVPVEDRTNHALCRPLPGAIITPPPVEIAAPQPVVGSAEWTQKKEGIPSLAPITNQSKSSALGAWGKGAPKIQASSAKPNSAADGNVRNTVGIPQGSQITTRLPAIGGGPIAVKASNVWQNTDTKPATPPVATSWDESPPVSRQGTPLSAPAASSAFAAPPGLPGRKNAWESGATAHLPSIAIPGKATSSVVQVPPDRSANMSAASWGSTGASNSGPDSDSGPATESDNPYAVHIQFSESMEEEFHGMQIRAMEDESELRELDSIAPGTWDGPAGAAWETANTGSWDDDPLDAEDLWNQNREIEKPILCNAHGIICKKGICAEYARQLRLVKRATEEVEWRKAAATNKSKKGRNKGRGGAKKNDENQSMNKGPAQNNPFRGPGAPVKTNWRGVAPRAIVDAEAIEKRDTTKDESDDGWGNSDQEGEPNAAAVTSTVSVDAVSATSWGVSENDFDPWATTTQPPVKTNRPGGKPPLGKKKPVQTNAASSWADQVDAEIAANGTNTFSVVSKKRGSKRDASATSWGMSTANSSSSGWGSVAKNDMPW